MATLLIPTEALARQLESELEGRLEVMRDDGLEGKPDFEDADAVAQLTREQTIFPATVDVSDAEATQAFITLENMLDFEEVEEADWGAAMEHLKADWDAAMEHLKAQGYPHGSTMTERASN